MTTRDRKLMYIIAPGLLVLAWRVFALVGRLSPAPAQVQAEAPPPISGSTPPAVAAPPLLESAKSAPLRPIFADDPRLALQKSIASAPWVRDPFYSTKFAHAPELPRAAPTHSGPRPPAPPWPLTGISRCGKKRSALLNGRIMQEGEYVESDYRITAIERDYVLIRQGDREFRYRLGQPPVEVALKKDTP